MIRLKEIAAIEDQTLSFYDDLVILINAVEDWDEKIIYLEEYIDQVQSFLGGTIDLSFIEAMKIVNSYGANSHAWKMESVSGLLRLLKSGNDHLKDSIDNLMIAIQLYLKNHD